MQDNTPRCLLGALYIASKKLNLKKLNAKIRTHGPTAKRKCHWALAHLALDWAIGSEVHSAFSRNPASAQCTANKCHQSPGVIAHGNGETPGVAMEVPVLYIIVRGGVGGCEIAERRAVFDANNNNR